MEKLNLRSYAHLGDCVYELFIREKTIFMTPNVRELHKKTIFYVNAQFQSELLEYLKQYLTEEENDLIRRARNVPVSVGRRNNQQIHHLATAFEVLIGFLYLENKPRLQEIFSLIEKNIEK